MPFLSRIVFILSLFATPLLLAQSYQQDLKFLKSALQIWKLSDETMHLYTDPYFGAVSFRLSEQHAPWSGNYFAMKHGGIAQRWQVGVKEYPRMRRILNQQQVLAMSNKEINLLSPVEKYDIFVGDYSFSATRHELEFRGPYRKSKPAIWEGFCNGVRCASGILPEPKVAIEVINPDSVHVKFQPSDLKALSGASYFYVEKYAQLGAPSQANKAEKQPNPAIFDLALRYFLAEKNKSFIVDANLGPEIWNESVIGFHREVSAPLELTAKEIEFYPTASSKVKVTGFLETLGEVDIHKTNGPTVAQTANGELHQKLDISYVLFLNNNGRVIDGEWSKVKNLRGVDFVWFGAGDGTDKDAFPNNSSSNKNLDFSRIKKLVNISAGRMCYQLFL